ncbi:replication initiation protein [Lutibacter sp.]
MNLPLLIKKNNALVDGNLPDRKVLANKLVNVLYSSYEREGNEFSITIPDLLRSLNMASDSGNNRKKIKEVIKFLQYPIELRDFEYKGKGIEWLSAPFLSRAKIEKGNSTLIHFRLDDELIAGLKQKEQYTIIDLNISNKFHSKYGIVIWEIYLRYKNQSRSGVPENWTYQTFTLEELNKKFGTKFKHNSKMLEGINRGLKEIKKITGKDIKVNFLSEKREFGFFWEKEKEIPKYLKTEKNFIAYIRKNKVNEDLYDDGKLCLSVSEKGRLYDKNTLQEYNKDDALVVWQKLYEKAKKGELSL